MSVNVEFENASEKQVSVLTAVKNKCRFDCCAGDQESWKNCTNTKCWLHPYRLGKNPYRNKREYTDEQLKVMRERMLKVRKYNKIDNYDTDQEKYSRL